MYKSKSEMLCFLDSNIKELKKHRTYCILFMLISGVAIFSAGLFFMLKSIVAGTIWLFIFGTAYIYEAISTYRTIKNINMCINKITEIKSKLQ